MGLCYGRASSMGTRRRVVAALLIGWAAGCSGSDPPAPIVVEPALHLVAMPESVAIPPSQSNTPALTSAHRRRNGTENTPGQPPRWTDFSARSTARRSSRWSQGSGALSFWAERTITR